MGTPYRRTPRSRAIIEEVEVLSKEGIDQSSTAGVKHIAWSIVARKGRRMNFERLPFDDTDGFGFQAKESLEGHLGLLCGAEEQNKKGAFKRS